MNGFDEDPLANGFDWNPEDVLWGEIDEAKGFI
jgi:hypothetical protein